MGRLTNFLGSPKAIAAGAAGQTIVWTGNDLPSQGVVAFHIGTTGTTANTLTLMMSRLRVKADSTTIFDVSLGAYRAWLQRFSQANYSVATTATAWSIWFNMFDIVDDDLADACQFPRGTVPTVEITTGGTTFAGNAYIGWTITDVEADYYPVLIGQQMNFAASLTNVTFPITEPGMLRGYVLNSVGLDRVRLELSGAQYEYLPGAQYVGATTGDIFRDSQQVEDGTTITDPIAHRLYSVQAGLGSSRIELTTGAAWGGITNELTLWAVRPQ